MRDYKKEIAAYLDEVKRQEKNRLDMNIEDIRRSKNVCVFGIGKTFYPVMDALLKYTGIKINLLSDNDPSKWGKRYSENLICISPDELETYKDEVAIILLTQYYKEIYEQLSNSGFKSIHVLMVFRLLYGDFFKNKKNIHTITENTLALFDVLEDEKSKEVLFTVIHNWFDFDISSAGYMGIYSDNEYYPEDIIKLSNQEIFVDAGAYDGDTLIDFLNKTNFAFNKVFSFELDKDNFHKLELTVDGLGRQIRNKIKLYNLGLADEEKDIRYEKGEGHSSVSEGGNALDFGNVAKLSDILKDEKITFIKMDIEGFEMKALQGAEKIIQKHKPKLAVCVYHKPEHLWQVPLYLKKTIPDYKIYLRHHGILEYDTVCYAV